VIVAFACAAAAFAANNYHEAIGRRRMARLRD
jgi:hypothetical protein